MGGAMLATDDQSDNGRSVTREDAPYRIAWRLAFVQRFAVKNP